jgi:threonyl-tRNA synthetase
LKPHTDSQRASSPRVQTAARGDRLLGGRDRVVADVRHEFSLVSPGQPIRPLHDLAGENSLQAQPAVTRLVRRRSDGSADFHAPPIFELLRTLRLGARERYSEPGHLRWFPHGVLLRRLITDWLEQFIESTIGGLPLATAALFRWGYPGAPLAELAGTFSERIYSVAHEGEADPLMLRYGGDPGFFGLLRDAPLPDGQLPLRCYELVDSFRRNRSGELRSIQRTRSFTFFDCHTVCSGAAAGMHEYLRVLSAHLELLCHLPGSHVPQVTLEAGDESALAALQSWADATGQNVVLDSTSRRSHYYRLLHNIYNERGLRTLHGQLDEVNGRRWRPTDDRHLVIVHSATGTLERWLLVFLLDALERDPPSLPMWLAPVHVRLLPALADNLWQAEQLADILGRGPVRIEIDDRDHTVASRVRDAERQWVPLVVVLGSSDGRDENGNVEVRMRGGKLMTMSSTEIIRHIRDQSAGFPFRCLGERRLTRMATFL